MPWTAADIPDQSGRIALITGANSGLGFETVRALARQGATVVMACRSLRKAAEARHDLLVTTAATGGVDLLSLDLADLASVSSASETMAARYGRLDLLINNAGVMAPPRALTKDGFELQFGTNHLGHFALTLSLLPLLRGASGARVVTVSSGAQYFGEIDFDDLQGERRYDRWKAYGQSKLANVMFALELQSRLETERAGILSLAAHPGLARTNLHQASLAAAGSRLEAIAYRLIDPLFQSASMGALPLLYAATSPDVESGRQYGPGGVGGMRGWPAEVRIAPAALDIGRRRRLWEESERLVSDRMRVTVPL